MDLDNQNIINQDISHINNLIEISRNNILQNQLFNKYKILKYIYILKKKKIRHRYYINNLYKKNSYIYYPFYQ